MRVLRADALLLLVAIVWGVGFVIQRIAMDAVGPVTFTGVRLLIGAVSLLPLLPLAAKLAPPHMRPV